MAPWVHTAVAVNQALATCCAAPAQEAHTVDAFDQWWTGDQMAQLRKDLVSGHRAANCEKCWKDERENKPSLRQNYNNMFSRYVNFDLLKQNLKNNNYHNIARPVTWELTVGNLCNIKCIMCNPSLSDKIQHEILSNAHAFVDFPVSVKKSQMAHIKNWTVLPTGQKLFSDILQSARWIKLQGGEALANRNIRELLEDVDGTQTVLSITTNGTILDKQLISVLKNFEKVQVSLSIEAAGSANDVIRYGSQWQDIQNTISVLQTMPNVELQLNHVLQATSVLFLPDVVTYAEDQNIHLNLIPLYKPKYLSLHVVAPELISQMLDQIKNIKIDHPKNNYIKLYVQQFVQGVNFDVELAAEFVKYVTVLDSVREVKLTPLISKLL